MKHFCTQRLHFLALGASACACGKLAQATTIAVQDDAERKAAKWFADLVKAEAEVARLSSQHDHLGTEMEMAKAQLRGWGDFFSGQPRNMPFIDTGDYAKNSQLNFAWCLGYDIASESELWKLMVGRADRSAERSQQLSNDNARLSSQLAEMREALAEVLAAFGSVETIREITPDDAAHVRKVSLLRLPTVADFYRWIAALHAAQGSPTKDEGPSKCARGHVWTNPYGDDWTPESGTSCDCGGTIWGTKDEGAHG